MKGVFASLILVVALVGLAHAGLESVSHVMTGSFTAVGSIEFSGFGYYDSAARRWTSLEAPRLGLTGGAATIVGIFGTSDGGALIVGNFDSVNSQATANVAFFDPTKNAWCAPLDIGLYQKGLNENLPCRGAPATATTAPTGPAQLPVEAMFQTPVSQSFPNTQGIATSLWSEADQGMSSSITSAYGMVRSSGLSGTTFGTPPVAVGLAPIFNGPGTVQGAAQNGDTIYVLGDFNQVGLAASTGPNATFQVNGLVALNYAAATRVWSFTPISGYRSYTSRPSNRLPRYCGWSGTANCGEADLNIALAGSCSVNPHDLTVTKFMVAGAGTHFFASTGGAGGFTQLWRFIPDQPSWIDIGQKGDDTAIAIKTNIGFGNPMRAAPASLAAFGLNRDWTVSGDNVWAVGQYDSRRDARTVAAGTAAFPFQHSVKLPLAGNTWGPGVVWPAGDADRVFDIDVPVPVPPGMTPPTRPTTPPYNGPLSSTGIQAIAPGPGGAVWIAYDERIAERAFATNPNANLQYQAIAQVSAAGAPGQKLGATDAEPIIFASPGAPAATVPPMTTMGTMGTGTGTTATTSAAPPTQAPSVDPSLVDRNGNLKKAYDIGTTAVQSLAVDSAGSLWADFGRDVYFGRVSSPADAAKRRFTRKFPAGYAVWDGSAWGPAPWGGGVRTGASTNEARFSVNGNYLITVGGQARRYFFNGAAGRAFNWRIQGAALYDAQNFAWIDPFAGERVGVFSVNGWNQRGPGVTADVGVDSAGVTVAHFMRDASAVILAGNFQFVGGAEYGGVVRFDGSALSAVVNGQGFYNAGGNLYPHLGDQNKVLVTVGQVNTITERPDGSGRLYFGGLFGSTTNEAGTGSCVRNIATATVGASTYENVDGGCNGEVRQLHIWQDTLFAGGTFSQCGNGDVNGVGYTLNIAQLGLADADPANRWAPLGVGVNGAVNAIVSWQQSNSVGARLIVGGAFTDAGGHGFPSLAAWDGNQWFPVLGGCQTDCDVNLLRSGSANGGGGRFIAAGTVYDLLLSPGGLIINVGGNLLRHDGAQFLDLGRGASYKTAQVPYNGQLAVNDTVGVIIANAAGNFGNQGNVATWTMPNNNNIIHQGFHGTDGAIIHIAASNSLVASAALVLAALVLAVAAM